MKIAKIIKSSQHESLVTSTGNNYFNYSCLTHFSEEIYSVLGV